MKTATLLTCLMMVACTPVRSTPRVNLVREGHQILSPTDIQLTTYRLTLQRSAEDAADCTLGLDGYSFFRGEVPDGGLGDNLPDPAHGTMVRLQRLVPAADAGQVWQDVGGSSLSPGTGVWAIAPMWGGTDPVHVEYLRATLDPGTGPADSLDYKHVLNFGVSYGRGSVDLDTQTLSLDILTDGGWLPANATVGSHEQSADCTGPVTPFGCR